MARERNSISGLSIDGPVEAIAYHAGLDAVFVATRGFYWTEGNDVSDHSFVVCLPIDGSCNGKPKPVVTTLTGADGVEGLASGAATLFASHKMFGRITRVHVERLPTGAKRELWLYGAEKLCMQ